MNAWERARTPRLTAVVGALPAVPAGLEVVRVRCGSDSQGLQSLVRSLALPSHHLVDALCTPLARQWLGVTGPPEPHAPLYAALRAEGAPTERVFLFQQLDDADPDVRGLVEGFVVAGNLPVLLSVGPDDPLLARVRDRLGTAAVVRSSRARTALADLPSDVLHVLVAAAIDDGPTSLDVLCERTDRSASHVLAALQAAFVRGVRVEDDGHGGFALDDDLVDDLREHTLPTVAAHLTAHAAPRAATEPLTPLDHARSAVAVGLWPRAMRRFATGPLLERAALAWAMGDAGTAIALLESADATDPRVSAAIWTVRWAMQPFDPSESTAPPHPLDPVLIAIRTGDLAEARALLDAAGPPDVLHLHVSAALALLEATPDLERAAHDVDTALSRAADPAQTARLQATGARIALRRGDATGARQAFLTALTGLDHTEQTVALARATAGLVEALDTPADHREPEGARVALRWLDRAVRANRTRPDALQYCKAALDGLMRRMPVDPPATRSRTGDPLIDLRRVSLELAALLARR